MKKTTEFTGGPVSYYKVQVANPKSIKGPYKAECLDVIKALGMSFSEGEAFKAIWRLCAARTIGKKKQSHSALYDCEKIAFYGQDILESEQEK